MSATTSADDEGFTGIGVSQLESLASSLASDTLLLNTTSSTSTSIATFQGGVWGLSSTSGDSSTTTRESAATPTERTGSQSPTPTETTDVSGTEGNDGSTNTLSAGTKAGIAVGCIVIVVALILFGLFFFRRRQRRRRMDGRVEEVKTPATTITTSSGPTQVGSEVGEADVGESESRVELPGSEVLKRGPVLKKAELITNANRHELHGNSSGQIGPATDG